MSFHTNYEKWKKMADPQHCAVCNQLPMPEGMIDIVELPFAWLSAEPVDCLKGACHLDDPFPGQAIGYTKKKNQYEDGEWEAFVIRMREEIAAG